VVDTTTKTFKVVWNRKSGPSQPVTYNKNNGIEWGRGDSWTQRGRVTLDMAEVARCEEALSVQEAEEKMKAVEARQERDRVTGLNALQPDSPTYNLLSPLAVLVKHAIDRNRVREPRMRQSIPTPELQALYSNVTKVTSAIDSDHDAREIGYASEITEIWTKLLQSASHWDGLPAHERMAMYKTYTFRSAEDAEDFAGEDSWIEKMLPRYIQELLDSLGSTKGSMPQISSLARVAGEHTARMEVLALFQRFWMNPDYSIGAR
jgi:hypothetical protein